MATLLALVAAVAFGRAAIALNVFTFIAVTGTLSTLIGVGLLKHNRLAYDLLLYFSSVIILSKFLILADIIHLNGALDHTVPSVVKSWTSILYHSFVIYYLTLSDVRKHFSEENG